MAVFRLMIRQYWRWALAFGCAALSPTISAGQAPQFDILNDYGEVGLLQTPTARVSENGEFAVGVSTVRPYNQLQFSLQVLDRLEAVFRYTEVSNRLYGPESFSGDQSYKDRSVDAKFMLLHEGPHWPSLAVGARDVGGTGLFSGEYLVANRRWYDWDFSLGIGWGRLGARGGLDNPLTEISDDFSDRSTDGTPGHSGFDRLFRGEEVGLFGGVRWSSPWSGLSFVAEWDGNDYESEALDNDQDVSYPINLGLNWRPNRIVDTSLGWERGSILTARVSFRTNFNEAQGVPKFLDPPMPKLRRPQDQLPDFPDKAQKSADTDAMLGSAEIETLRPGTTMHLRQAMAEQGFGLQGYSYQADTGTLQVWYAQSRYRSQAEAFGRLSRVLAQRAPPEVSNFTLIEVYLGFEAYRVNLVRSEVERLALGRAAPEEAERAIRVSGPDLFSNWQQHGGTQDYPGLSFSSGPGWRQHVGGPDGFYLFQLWWKLGASLSLAPNWSISTQVGANIYNNFDRLELQSDSVLPHVRSDIAQYLKEGKNNLVRLETNYFFPVGESWYGRVSAGLFEEMYGGIAGEVLYRPFQSPLALGLDVARVRKRDYDQRLDFLDYQVTTGHLTAYYDMRAIDTLVQFSYGRYLAGDWGGTLNIAHFFDSGVSVGAFATRTNVSAEDFGEGSFDKGFYVNIPMDLFFARSTRRRAPILFRPLTRDGGQMVRDGIRLYGATETVPPLGGKARSGLIR